MIWAEPSQKHQPFSAFFPFLPNLRIVEPHQQSCSCPCLCLESNEPLLLLSESLDAFRVGQICQPQSTSANPQASRDDAGLVYGKIDI